MLTSVRLGLTEYGPEASALALDFLHQLTSHVVLHGLPAEQPVRRALLPFVKHLLDLILSNGVNSEVLQGSSGAVFALICCFQVRELLRRLARQGPVVLTRLWSALTNYAYQGKKLNLSGFAEFRE